MLAVYRGVDYFISLPCFLTIHSLITVLAGQCFRPGKGNSASAKRTIQDLKNATRCSENCRQESECLSFTYNSAEGKCYLKPDEATFNDNHEAISGNKADCTGKSIAPPFSQIQILRFTLNN